MKLNKLFLMAAMGLGLFACSENELEGNGPDSAQNEGSTYVGFTIDFSKTQTRATPGTDAEQKINTAYVILADGNTISQVVSSVADGSNKYVLQTTPGPHDFYVVVNPTTAPTTSNTVSEYFNTGVVIEANEFANTTTDSESFLMASVKKETFDIADGVTEKEALDGTDAATNNFTINVERVAAKVTMTCADPKLTSDNNNAAGGKISDTKFNLNGGATKAYRMAQSTIKEIPDNAWSYTVKGVDVATTGDHTAAAPAYCLENLHAIADNYLQKNTTYLTLKTTFKPTNVVNCNDPLNGLTSNKYVEGSGDELTFYVVKQGELAGNYLMKKDLEDFQTSDGNEGKYPEGVEKLSGPYGNGECWFGPIWIGQEEADDAIAPIYRNTWYNLEITGITLPGDPEEPTIDPEQPLTPKTNVAITLSVMPWNFINREIDLQ